MNIAMFEDNPVHAKMISNVLEHWAQAEKKQIVITRFASPNEAKDVSVFDCIMLDVVMPDMNGLEFAKQIRSSGIRVPIVFISDHVEYSLAGYEVDALRFINKNDIDFPAKLKECMDKTAYEVENSIRLYYTYKENGSFTSVPMSDILYFEVYDHDLIVHTFKGSHAERKTLGLLLSGLPDQFVQCSRSHVINILQVSRLSQREVIIRNGDKLPVTKHFYEAVFKIYIRFH